MSQIGKYRIVNPIIRPLTGQKQAICAQKHVLIQVVNVDNDLNECRVVLNVCVVLCVECSQRHQQRTAACNVHLGRRSFEGRAGRIRSKRVHDVLAAIVVNEHQSHLQYSSGKHAANCRVKYARIQLWSATRLFYCCTKNYCS